MPDDIGSGFSDALIGGVLGIFLSAILGVIPNLPSIPASYISIFQLFEVVFLIGSILIILKMESWGIGYGVGWLIATGVLSSVGLVESWLFTIYVIVGVLVLIGKILQKIKQ